MTELANKPLTYVETTVPSYLTARATTDAVTSNYQQLTRRWWADAKNRYELVASQVVIDEASAGDSDAARERIAALVRDVSILPPSPEAIQLAAEYVILLQLPPKAINDSLHIAYAVVFGAEYLVTWNLRHLASSLTMRQITAFNIGRGLHVPLIVTPEYLLQLQDPEM